MNSYYVPPEHQPQQEREPELLRARTGPRPARTGAGPHASRTNRERTRGQGKRAAIRRSMDGDR